MDYFQGVVQDYLRSVRSRFVNSECRIELDAGSTAKDAHWYCDFVTVDFAESAAYLCEVSFARNLYSLIRRLDAWHQQWDRVRASVIRDCQLPADWNVGVWVFIPDDMRVVLRERARALKPQSLITNVRLTALEDILPWKYDLWKGNPYLARTLEEGDRPTPDAPGVP